MNNEQKRYDGKLKEITVKKNKVVIEYTDNTPVEGIGIISKTKKETIDHPISERFGNIFRSFLGHGLVKMGLLCANLNDKAMKSRKCVSMSEFKNFGVASIKISGDGENEKININLTFETADGEIVPINVPAIKMAGGYVYEALLRDDLENVTSEANMFIDDKNYLGQQLSMFAEEDSEQF